jgi:hypothetical protein
MVEIEVDDHMVDFRHSGKPFTFLDIQKIAHQTSQKARNNVQVDEKTGVEIAGEDDNKLYEDDANEHLKSFILDNIIDGGGPETTGKFGTGFLTTYLLSKIVEISGIYTSFQEDEQPGFDDMAY